ncbi:MAG: ORF6N domain-containing protein [Oligoflexia bacterium]|nr:ORF6N domain-containing protein [Oligoflexia bacterium]
MDQLSHQEITQRIFFIRGHRVMLDADLAELYSVETKSLNRAVRRNQNRFPEDFMFQLTEKEEEFLRYQIGTSRLTEKYGSWGGRRHLPLVFTEQGVAMLSSVLRSEKAALVNVEIMRTFVKFREFLLTNQELARKLEELEKRHDAQFKIIFDAIRELMRPPVPPKGRIGI